MEALGMVECMGLVAMIAAAVLVFTIVVIGLALYLK